MIAYSYPGEKSVHFLSGEWRKNQEDQNGFVLAPFLKSEDSYTLLDSLPISSKLFFEQIKNFSAPKREVPCVISKHDYIEMGQQALDLLNSSYLKKIVLSRVKKLPLSTSYKEIFENLTQKYPNAFVYLAVGPFGIWAGASPEILIESDYKKLKTVALAGTQEYVHSKNKYDWGDKEKEEQNLVSEYIAEILKQNQVPFHMGQPQTVQAGNVVHLKSIFECDVKNKEQVHQILKSLHPTPAVAGISTPTSIEEIIRLEPHNRKFYTGYIGEISDFNTRLYVNLRCMEFIENNVYLYVGGGFTRHSDVESEWKETESKARVLLGVL